MTGNDVQGQRHDRTALVLYGSETGNSRDVAQDLGRGLERLRFRTSVAEMDRVEINLLLKYSIVIFAISTTGQGEFPRNARKFWKSLLRKRLPPDCLGHVSFTTFGLGDSSYPKFNWAARKLHKRLEQLGAKEFYPRGEADDQHNEGIDGTFLSWSVDLRKHLLALYPLPDGVDPIPPEVFLPPKFTLELLENAPEHGPQQNTGREAIHLAENHSLSNLQQHTDNHIDNLDSTTNPPEANKEDHAMTNIPPSVEQEPEFCPQLKGYLEGEEDPVDSKLPPSDFLPIPKAFKIKLIQNKRVTPNDHWQDVRLLTFLMEDDIKYKPGDTITIFPKNFPEDVQTLINLMDWNRVADKALKFEPTSPDFYNDPLLVSAVPDLYPLPDTTLRQLLTHNLDITAIPNRFFFEFISHWTSDPMHKERLLEFNNPAFTDEFFDYTTRPRRSMLEVLADFPSVKIPFRHAATVFPVIRGRQFSICSGGGQSWHPQKPPVKVHLQRVQILVAIVKYKTVLQKIRQGLCSRYIASLTPGVRINIHLNSNDTFYKVVNEMPTLPIVMISAGTGVAPCRSLIWDRGEVDSIQPIGMKGECVLFYGGRNKYADYYFKDEWKHPLLRAKVFTAFSRDQKEKIYVQDVIRQQGKMLAQLIKGRDAVVYVCGSSGNMPKAVRAALLDVLEEDVGVGSRAKVEEAFEVMEKKGHYIQETW